MMPRPSSAFVVLPLILRSYGVTSAFSAILSPRRRPMTVQSSAMTHRLRHMDVGNVGDDVARRQHSCSSGGVGGGGVIRWGSRRDDILSLSASSTTTTSEELIPRDILFGNPEYSSPLLSPDGNRLAYLAPSPNGVMNIWIRNLASVETTITTTTSSSSSSSSLNNNINTKDIMITNEPKRAIRSYAWAYDNETILYMNDVDGDENFHLFAVDISAMTTTSSTAPPSFASNIDDKDIASAISSSSPSSPSSTTTTSPAQQPFPVRDLTPGNNIKAQNIITNRYHPNQILVGTNERNSKIFDMYRIFYKSGTKYLDTINPGDVLGWKVEERSFEIRAATARNPTDSSTTIRIRQTSDIVLGSHEDVEWKDVFHFPYGEEGGLLDFFPDNGKTAYLTSSLGRETTALLKVDTETGETLEELYSNDMCNVGGVTLDKVTKELRALTYNYARTERIFFNDELERDYAFLKTYAPEPNCEIGVASRSLDETRWVVSYFRSDGPSSYVLYDKPTRNVVPLFVSNPKLLKYKFAHMEDVRILAHDGLELVAYLTRAVTDAPSPLILLVHGGPWARDYWGFNARAQWFANRGYATLQVNFRGSTGYGKTFLHKGDGQWGVGDMQHDLTSAVNWAIEEGIADKDNICIYGGSYGGYACLAGLTFTPDIYKCGVDIVGPSNIKTLLDSIPDYWAPLRNGMLLKIGDVDNDEEFNKKISPLYHVDSITAPLLIGQGANDPRVKQAEADQIAFSMMEKGIPVEYVLYPDEGHGFARPENRIDFQGRAELFLAKHLGGRAEEFVAVEGSTARFPLLETNEAIVS